MQNDQEIWDLYDANYQYKGTFVRGRGRIPDGLYHKTVEVIPTDMQGTLLLTRRSLRKKSGAGQLEFPAGSVISGETEEEAAIRELQEETGLRPSKIFHLQTARSPGIIRYTYLAYVPNLTTAKIRYTEGEVMGHRFVDYETWLALLTTGEYNGFRTRFYNDKLFAVVKKLVHYYAEKERPQKNTEPQHHKPLVKSNGLSAKHHSSNNSHFEEDDDPTAVPDWEPEIEQGDDGS